MNTLVALNITFATAYMYKVLITAVRLLTLYTKQSKKKREERVRDESTWQRWCTSLPPKLAHGARVHVCVC